MGPDIAAEKEAQSSNAEPASTPHSPIPASVDRSRGLAMIKRLLVALVLVALIGAAAYFGYPTVRTAMTTVSTDDAYVNAHVTYVAPRITETVTEVKVDNNDFVKQGDLLILLDKRAWTIRVGQAKAALDLAHKGLAQQVAKAKAAAAEAKANRYKLASAMTDVKNRVADLRSAVATMKEKEAQQKLAKLEAERFATLARKGSVTQEQADIRQTDYEQAKSAYQAALEKARSIRAALEVPEEPPSGKLEEVPADLDQRHSTVLSAFAAFAQNLADLGLELPRYREPPNEFIARLLKAAPHGDINAAIEQTVAKSPGVESARAQIEQTKEDLALAELQLSYCEIRADIDGFISNRNVNPGDRVAANQKLMAIRSSEDVWVDCNFKETQLASIRIGQPVDLYVDAYPGKVFQGRVTGFSPGTGASLALLPAQNATGNFVKIVQRLPVKVELVDTIPRDTPLFVGLSVVPYIRVHEKPEGPNAGQRLRGMLPNPASAGSGPPARSSP